MAKNLYGVFYFDRGSRRQYYHETYTSLNYAKYMAQMCREYVKKPTKVCKIKMVLTEVA